MFCQLEQALCRIVVRLAGDLIHEYVRAGRDDVVLDRHFGRGETVRAPDLSRGSKSVSNLFDRNIVSRSVFFLGFPVLFIHDQYFVDVLTGVLPVRENEIMTAATFGTRSREL